MIHPLPVCILCGRRADAAHQTCIDAVYSDLTRIPELHRALADVLEPGASPSARVSGSRTAPLPVRLEPLSLRARGGIASILGTWETDWRQEFGLSRPAHADREQLLAGDAALVPIVYFLRQWLSTAVRRHPAVDEFAGEVRHIVHTCRIALGDLADAQRIGCCPVVEEAGRTCGAVLYAYPTATAIRCERCGAEWPRSRWVLLGKTIVGERDRAA